MFDIWQSRAAQQVQGVADVHELDTPKVTGITQLNSYYQSVLGAPSSPTSQGPSNAVTVAGELNAYLGAGSAAETGATRYPTSRNAVGRVAASTADDGATEAGDGQLSGLLSATSPVRALAQNGDWESLAAWKITASSPASPAARSRELIADRAVQGDLARYAAAFQGQGGEPTQAPAATPRVPSREVAAFNDHADYSTSADPRAVAGERAEDVPARVVADIVGGFTPLPEA